MIVVLTILWILSIISFFYAVPYGNYFFGDSNLVSFLGLTNIFILFAVPILSMILGVARLAFRMRRRKMVSNGLWIFWGINLVSLITLGSITSRHFAEGQSVEIPNSISHIDQDTLHLDISPYEELSELNLNMGSIVLTEDKLINNEITLSIVKSETSNFQLSQKNYSRGKTTTEASHLASEIDFQPLIQDNQITFPRSFPIHKGNKWRGQRIRLTLAVPEGKTIYLGKHTRGRLDHIHIDRSVERPWPYSNHIWTMTANGLVCKEYIEQNNKKSEYDFKDFSELQIEGLMKVSIEKGDQFKVRMTGKDVYTQKVEMNHINKALVITSGLKKTKAPVRLYITMPSLKKLDAESTDDIKISGFDEPKMSIKSEGRYDIKAFVNVDSLYIRQKGKHEIDLRGSGKYLKIDMESKAFLDAEHFTVDDANVLAKSRSNAKLAVVKTLTIARGKTCKIRNEGNATVISDELIDQ